jgi:hypothetical protein
MSKHLPTFPPEFTMDETGAVRAMHVRVRPGPAVRAVQPNPDCLVFFYLGNDGFPVGFKFLEPVPGLAISQQVHRFMLDADGRPAGIHSDNPEHFYLALSDLLRAAVESGKASEGLAVLSY